MTGDLRVARLLLCLSDGKALSHNVQVLSYIMVEKERSPLSELMFLRGITQQEFADAFGVDRKTVSNWVTGKTVARLTLGEWRKVSEILGVPIERLPDDFSPRPVHDTTKTVALEED